ncbi:MAG: ribonuclease H-like domain-containing protein [Gammaproteobacteria bacterium]|nr:ribonuclease H-like domain-containing protein [Gammaproteobacteria bacterium]
MELSERLAALRRQAGGAAPAEDERARVLARLRGDILRVRAEGRAARKRPAAPRDDAALAQALDGEIAAPGVVRIGAWLAPGTRHGAQVLCADALPGALERLSAGALGAGPRDVVFMDTETTGLSGGTGTLVFLLGLARFGEHGLEICQLVLSGFHGERALLALARTFVAGSAVVVSFNGRSFDAPLLAARYRLAGEPDPFAPLEHVDLLHATRRAFAARWPDCRLQTAEQRLLGYRRHDDLPGAEAPIAWFEWVRDGSAALLPRACTHNRDDLLSLAALAVALERCHLDPVHADADVRACARFALRNGDTDRVYTYLLERRPRLDARARHELARLARRRGEWPVAQEIWETLAREGDMQALEALAKHHEHRTRDIPLALACARELIARAPDDERHCRREARLQARLARRRSNG